MRGTPSPTLVLDADNPTGKTLAVGTGFIQLFRGIGQVIGVALASAVFQSVLNTELHKRITGDGAEDEITRIRHDSTLVDRLPPDLQSAARDSYAIGLKWVFIVATVCTGMAYCVRLFVSILAFSPSECVANENMADSLEVIRRPC